MPAARGGRFILRLVTASPEAVDYAGTLEVEGATSEVVAHVALPSGSVELEGAAAPEWLADQARAALRAAFRAHRTGVPWPRRLQRWKEEDPAGRGEGKPGDE